MLRLHSDLAPGLAADLQPGSAHPRGLPPAVPSRPLSDPALEPGALQGTEEMQILLLDISK